MEGETDIEILWLPATSAIQKNGVVTLKTTYANYIEKAFSVKKSSMVE